MTAADAVTVAQAERALDILGGFDTKRHIMICADPEKPKCCDRETGIEAWNFLKRRLSELGLGGKAGVLRNKVSCLRVCMAGPIAVVYPDGVWYGGVSVEDVEEIVESHLMNDVPVERLLIPDPRYTPGAVRAKKIDRDAPSV